MAEESKLDLRTAAGGIILLVNAAPGARRNGIVGIREGALRVAVTQVAEKGKANHAIIEVLAKQLDLRKAQISLISGPTARHKQFLVSGVSAEEIASRVAKCVGGNE